MSLKHSHWQRQWRKNPLNGRPSIAHRWIRTVHYPVQYVRNWPVVHKLSWLIPPDASTTHHRHQ
ncbi:hypothetical protein THIOM_005258 [Candidatus Thiomargarita nelsonii]|uniref:Uncharacterized protein n=1 Tax=Candidatus Thiomargarita nelsonii TaxID=1003181 RepID=A0A176RTR1_9GAMM|nr:hypothetical protein THIOM_005258 [Candidatus Thiomargarita nelsonii]